MVRTTGKGKETLQRTASKRIVDKLHEVLLVMTKRAVSRKGRRETTA